MAGLVAASNILLLFLFCACDGGYFAQRNHTRRSFHKYLREKEQIETTTLSTTTVLPTTTTTTTILPRTTTTLWVQKTTSDGGILLLPDDMRPPGLSRVRHITSPLFKSPDSCHTIISTCSFCNCFTWSKSKIKGLSLIIKSNYTHPPPPKWAYVHYTFNFSSL